MYKEILIKCFKSKLFSKKVYMYNPGVCDKTSNNKFFDCPPRMADGRFFTDYRSNRYVNNMTRIQNDLEGSYSYRMFLQHNSKNLMRVNRRYNKQKNGCRSCNAKQSNVMTLCHYNDMGAKCEPQDPFGMGMANVADSMKPIPYIARLPAYVTHQGVDPTNVVLRD